MKRSEMVEILTRVILNNQTEFRLIQEEADLIAVSKSGYCTEIEIKVSKADLLNDLKKEKHTKPRDRRIARYFFAIPKELEQVALESLPVDIGIITVELKKGRTRYTVNVVRPATKNKNSDKISIQDLTKLYYLQNFRYWSRMS